MRSMCSPAPSRTSGSRAFGVRSSMEDLLFNIELSLDIGSVRRKTDQARIRVEHKPPVSRFNPSQSGVQEQDGNQHLPFRQLDQQSKQMYLLTLLPILLEQKQGGLLLGLHITNIFLKLLITLQAWTFYQPSTFKNHFTCAGGKKPKYLKKAIYTKQYTKASQRHCQVLS